MHIHISTLFQILSHISHYRILSIVPCAIECIFINYVFYDLGLIPGLGRSLGEGKGYPLSILAWRISWTL